MEISHLLSSKPKRLITITPDITVIEAVQIMNKHRIGAVVVLKDDALVGIFTERDILQRVLAESKPTENTLVQDVMTTNPTTIPPSETVEDAMAIMTEKRHRHLPVVDNAQLVGMVSIGDITRALLEENQMQASHLRSYITGEF